MYSVHAVVFKTQNGTTSRHEVLIHDTMSPVQEMHLIDPKLKIADCSAGTFSATINPNNPGYSLVERFNTILKIYKGSTQIWSGRVISESMDFLNRRSIGVEGALAFLNDSVQPIAYYGTGRSPAYILNTLLTIHNQKVVEDRKLYVGAVTGFSSDDYGSFVFETNNGNTWQELQNNLLNRLDGHLFVTYSNNKAYINYYEDYPNTASQTINFGDNLLDFTRNWNLSNIATVILPRGAALDTDTSDGQKAYITLKSSNEDSNPVSDGSYVNDKLTVSGQYLVNNELYSKYGRVEKVVDFSDSTTAQDLFALAKNYILSMQFDELELSVSAVDLHMLTSNYVSFNLLDEVLCISQPHGMSKYFPIAEIDIALDHPENTKYTMSDHLVNSSMSGAFGKFKSEINNRFKSLATPGHILDLAKIEASSIINRKTTGYVSVINMFENEEEGVAQAIVISSSPDWKTANKYWIWNMNGLAYYSATTSSQIAERQGTANPYAYGELDDTNFEQPRYYDLAITMDGTIVANHIKTGVLSDGYGYNYWNLETGEFSLQPGAKMYYGSGSSDYQSVFDMIYNTDKALNRRAGSANHLNGTADWAEWRKSGGWTLDGAEALCASKYSANDNDTLISPARQLKYSDIKGYVMTFSLEGTTASNDWGTISTTNAFIICVELVTSSGTVHGRCEKAFMFEDEYTRRFTTFEMVNSTFGLSNDYTIYDSDYVDIRLINRSTHGLAIRRPQFERGNTPTDWAISDADADKAAQNKATTAYNASIAAAATMDKQVQQNAVTEAQALSQQALTESKTFASAISATDRTYSDGILAAFDRSLTQRNVLERLTGGFDKSGIYLYNGELLVNADYIRSGSLEAGILTAGVIHDVLDKCKWNLDNGYFETRNGVFINSEVQGQLVCGTDDGSKIVFEDGAIKFYWDGHYIGSISSAYVNGYSAIKTEARNIYSHADESLMIFGEGSSQCGAYELKTNGRYNGEYFIHYVTDIDSDGQGWVNPIKRTLHFTLDGNSNMIGNVWDNSGVWS